MRGRSRSRRMSGVGWGLFFIGLGVVLLLSQLGWLEGDVIRHAWPFWPALFGIANLLHVRSAKNVSDGLMMLGLSAYLFVSNEGLFGLGWSNSWPLVLVAIGVAELAKAIASRWLPERETVVEVSEVDEEEESHA